jgi:hypothetical protein
VATLTGRSTTFAAIAASATFGRGSPLEPNPPPTCGEITRTWPGSSPNSLPIERATPEALCVESWSVRPPCSHAATVACGSSGLLWKAGVV